MLPRRPANLFRSRWTALLWAAGVLLTAVMTIGFGPDAGPGNGAMVDATGAPVQDADLKALQSAIEGMR
jgi:hypothetical protein